MLQYVSWIENIRIPWQEQKPWLAHAHCARLPLHPLAPITHLSSGPEGCNKEPHPLHSHPFLKTIKLILDSCFGVYKSQQ